MTHAERTLILQDVQKNSISMTHVLTGQLGDSPTLPTARSHGHERTADRYA